MEEVGDIDLHKWMYTAVEITKYDPQYRDENGHYRKEEWIGFFQLGKLVGTEILSLKSYLEAENKYIAAANLFFCFHSCKMVRVRRIEKHDWSSYSLDDKDELRNIFDQLQEDAEFSVQQLPALVKLVLRELAWYEILSAENSEIAVRFGWDFYMYFNSTKDMKELLEEVKRSTGLFVGR